jgi:AmpE protein
MTFLTLVLALLLERLLPQRLPRTHRWFDGYWQRLAGVGWLRDLLGRPWAIALVLLPPLALLVLLQGLFDPFGSLGALLFGVLVLHYSLGPDELGAQADEFVRARDAGDQERASALAQQFCLSEVPDEEPRRSFSVARAVVVLACRRLVGPVFWFVILGPLGAAAYRLVHLLAPQLQDEPATPEMRRYGEALRDLADWAPARVTAAGYAVAGNFDAVAHAWRHFEYQPG